MKLEFKQVYLHFFCQEMSELVAWLLRVPPDSVKKKGKNSLKLIELRLIVLSCSENTYALVHSLRQVTN